MRILVTGSLLALSLALMGCPSTTTLGMARTLDRGHLQLAVAPAITGFLASPGANYEGPPGGLQLEVAGRYGLTDRVELGLKAWGFGGLIESKFSLLRSDPQHGIDLAIAPAAGAIFSGTLTSTQGFSQYDFYLPVLIGINVNGHQLVIAPRAIDALNVGPNGSNYLFLGGSVGFAIRINDWLRLMPEVAFQRSVIGGTPLAYFNAGLGFLIGGYEGAPPP